MEIALLKEKLVDTNERPATCTWEVSRPTLLLLQWSSTSHPLCRTLRLHPVDASPAPVVEFFSLAPVTHAAPAPVVECMARAPVAYVVEYIAPAPAGYDEFAPVVECVASWVRHTCTCRRVHGVCAGGAAPAPVSPESWMFVPRCAGRLMTVSVSTLLRLRPLRRRDFRMVFPKDMFKGAVCGTIVHEGRGLNMTLDAQSFELVHHKTVFYNHPEKITEAETLKTVKGAAYVHVFHHQLCADRHDADGKGFNTSPAFAASYVARSFFFVFSLLRGTHPADIDNVSYRWCPGTDHVICR